MYDIITIGSATFDIFLRSKGLIKKIEKFITKKGICFPFGSKVDLEDIFFTTGGGGTNTAATFSNQGFKVAFCGSIGKDIFGKEILGDLERFKIDRKFVFEKKERPTSLSVIFSQAKDRTVFVFRGASEILERKDIPWNELRAEWIYLAPLSGKLANLFSDFVDFAKKKNIKVFANPGNSQLNLGIRKLKPILEKIDILLLNQEEASILTKVPYQKEREVFKKLDEFVPGIAIMTKGKEGAVVSDGNYLFEGKAPKVPLVEKTGAGDAFGSGFLVGFIKKKKIDFALQFGLANSAACIQKIGAKEGILKKDQTWKKVRIKKTKLK